MLDGHEHDVELRIVSAEITPVVRSCYYQVMRASAEQGQRTFTRAKRRDQLIDCAIDAIAELGFQRATVGEVARRAGVSKGVVTYHFTAKDDLMFAVVGRVFDSVQEFLESRLLGVEPARFVAEYITTWVDYYRTHGRCMLALGEIWSGFRDEAGRQRFGGKAVEGELAAVQAMLERGQQDGSLGDFSARVIAVSMKGALNALHAQLVAAPELDLDAYGHELALLFERATRSRS